MATKTRIYIVRCKPSGATHLVEAASASAARNHVTRNDYSVEVASALDVARHITDLGLQVQVAGDAAPEAEPAAVEG